MPDPFLTLNVNENADDAEVRHAYLALVRRYPPEQHPEAFRTISEAYEAVRDETSRARIRVFGNLTADKTLLDVLPKLPTPRSRVGMERWLEGLKGDARRG